MLDALLPYEREVLGRWDAGDSIADIAAETGRSRGAVRDVVYNYDDRPDPDPRPALAEVNARFVAACARARERETRRMRQGMLEVGEIEAMLRERCDAVFWELFPNARKEGHELCIGSLSGEPGQSLRMHVGNGPKRGVWTDFSAGGVGGDVICLIEQALFGGDRGQAVRWGKSFLHIDDGGGSGAQADPERIDRMRIEAQAASARRAAEAEAQAARIVASARARWHEALPLARGDKVDRYLAARAIDLGLLPRRRGYGPGSLRFNPSLQYGARIEGGPEPLRLPAMVAQVNALDGGFIATHRHYLDRRIDWKAGADLVGVDAKGRPNDVKKVLGSPRGGHIALWKGAHDCALKDIPEGVDVWASEGCEDGLTAACAHPDRRVVCFVALGFLKDLELPRQMGRLILLQQNDPPGSEAAALFRDGVAALRGRGHRVAVSPAPAGWKDINAFAMAQAGLRAP